VYFPLCTALQGRLRKKFGADQSFHMGAFFLVELFGLLNDEWIRDGHRVGHQGAGGQNNTLVETVRKH
jgi:hypothetical protein